MAFQEEPQASLKRKRSSKSGRAARSTRKAKTLSYLELLPPEILQPIFFYSQNVELTQTSTTMLRKLSSDRIYEEFCKRLLFPGAGNERKFHTLSDLWDFKCAEVGVKDPAVLKTITRVMNSRFFTWAFFRRLLHQEYGTIPLGSSGPSWFQEIMKQPAHFRIDRALKASADMPWAWDVFLADNGIRSDVLYAHTFRYLVPDIEAEIPDKLLKPPFTPDKVILLYLLLNGFTFRRSQPFLTTATLRAAILENAHAMVLALIYDRNDVDFEQLLHTAVVEAGCDPTMVYIIMLWHSLENDLEYTSEGTLARLHSEEPSPMLSPVIWNWAERESMNKNWKGEWLELNLKLSLSGKGIISPEVYLATDPKKRRNLLPP